MAPLPWLLLSPPPPPSSSLISCRAAQPQPHLRAQPPPSPSPAPPQLAPPNPKPAPSPILTCALNCPHFQSCSGCSQELNLHRPIILDEVTSFFKNHGVSDFTFDTCRLWGWRCRAKLAVRGTSAVPLIGLYEEGTHNVVDIPQCKAHHPNINAAVELLKQGIIELNVEPYDEDQRTGELRYVQMAVTTHNTSLPTSERYRSGKVQLTLVWNSRSENSSSAEKLNALAQFLWRNGGRSNNVHLIHSVWANFQTSANNVIFGNRWRHLLGESDFWEHFGGIDVSLAPSSFGQANTRAFDSLLRKLQKYVPYGSSVSDIYAGAGVIGLSLAAARKCRSVKCIDTNKESKLSFEKTAERLSKSLDSSISWHHADASVNPTSWLVGSDVVVVDPPRKGLSPPLLNALQTLSTGKPKVRLPNSSSSIVEKRPWVLRAREASVHIESKTTLKENFSLPETLIYISCGWESFKEDCKSLLSNGAWHLDKVHGFNFFPGTQSIEVLAVFKKGRPEGSLKKKKLRKKQKKPS